MRCTSSRSLQLILTALTATTLAHAADPIKANIKPGLWEVTLNPQVSGQLAIPDDELAKLTPEQRTRMEAAMKSYAANSNKSHVYKECMTPEKIARGFSLDKQSDDMACTRKLLSNSASEVTVHDECNGPQQKTVSDVHFEIKGGTQMNGKINFVMSSTNGKSMTMNSTVQGTWLGASCGSIKDREVEK